MTPRKKQQPPKPAERSEDGPRKPEAADAPKGRVKQQPRAYPDIVDDTLDDSFPASDPPFWAGR
jgi:hypothetical protein